MSASNYNIELLETKSDEQKDKEWRKVYEEIHKQKVYYPNCEVCARIFVPRTIQQHKCNDCLHQAFRASGQKSKRTVKYLPI